ncbi:MAG TPA: hypothetical protein VIH76_19595 [Candidatus Acidoferrales bacterium]
MEQSIEDVILELLEQNKKWWEQAAATCEARAVHLPSGEKETEQLMGAVYRERADKHSQAIEGLRKKVESAHG